MQLLMEDINEIIRQDEQNMNKLNTYKKILEDLMHSDDDESTQDFKTYTD